MLNAAKRFLEEELGSVSLHDTYVLWGGQKPSALCRGVGCPHRFLISLAAAGGKEERRQSGDTPQRGD